MPVLVVFENVDQVCEFYERLYERLDEDGELSGQGQEVTLPTNDSSESEVVSTKKRRGRPKKSEIDTNDPVCVESAVVEKPVQVDTPAPSVANLPAPSVQDVREACVKASDAIGAAKVVELLNKYTGGVSSKAADVPEDLRGNLISDIDKLLEAAV
jgi:hypothetical protein